MSPQLKKGISPISSHTHASTIVARPLTLTYSTLSYFLKVGERVCSHYYVFHPLSPSSSPPSPLPIVLSSTSFLSSFSFSLFPFSSSVKTLSKRIGELEGEKQHLSGTVSSLQTQLAAKAAALEEVETQMEELKAKGKEVCLMLESCDHRIVTVCHSLLMACVLVV